MRRVSTLHIIVLNVYWIGLSFMWNSLHVILLPAVLLNFVPDTQKNSYLGLLTFFGLIMALVIQPISGALSDRWASRWGRRRPLIVIGTTFDFVFLALLGWAGGLWMLFIGYLGLQISSNLAHGPVQGLMPDRVPPQQLGSASGMKNMMDMGGLVVSSLIVGRMVPPDVRQPVGAMLVVAFLLAVSAAITIVGADEEPTGQRRAGNLATGSRGWREIWLEALRVDWRAHTGYWWLIASRFFYLFGIYGIQVFAQYFVRDKMNVSNPVQATGDLMAAIVFTLMVFAIGAGYLCDKWGRKRVQALAGIFGGVGALLLLAAQTPTQLLIYGSVLGAGIGIFLSANWALANDLAPASQAGKFLGLTNLATAGAGAAGRLEGPLIDVLNNAWPGLWRGWTMLFVLGALCILLSTVLLVKIPERLDKSQLPNVNYQS
jgi:MFS family permease